MDPVARIQSAYPRIWHLGHRHMGRSTPLSERDHRLLIHLPADGPLPVAALAEHLATAPSTLSEHLGALEDAGFVSRRPDDHDRRRVVVTLTDAGRQARRAHGPLDPDALERAVARLGDRAEAVVAALEALANAMEPS